MVPSMPEPVRRATAARRAGGACQAFCDGCERRVHRESAAVPADRSPRREMLHPLPAALPLALGEDAGRRRPGRSGSGRSGLHPARPRRDPGVVPGRRRGTGDHRPHRPRRHRDHPAPAVGPRQPVYCDEHYPDHPGGNGRASPAPVRGPGRGGVPGDRRRRAAVTRRGRRVRRGPDRSRDGPGRRSWPPSSAPTRSTPRSGWPRSPAGSPTATWPRSSTAWPPSAPPARS